MSNIDAITTNEDANETETWLAWMDGDRENAVEFEVPVYGPGFDPAEAAARALGVDVCEELNMAPKSSGYAYL